MLLICHPATRKLLDAVWYMSSSFVVSPSETLSSRDHHQAIADQVQSIKKDKPIIKIKFIRNLIPNIKQQQKIATTPISDTNVLNLKSKCMSYI